MKPNNGHNKDNSMMNILYNTILNLCVQFIKCILFHIIKCMYDLCTTHHKLTKNVKMINCMKTIIDKLVLN